MDYHMQFIVWHPFEKSIYVPAHATPRMTKAAAEIGSNVSSICAAYVQVNCRKCMIGYNRLDIQMGLRSMHN